MNDSVSAFDLPPELPVPPKAGKFDAFGSVQRRRDGTWATSGECEAEIREVILKFEELYSGLMPPSPTPVDDEIHVDVPEIVLPDDLPKTLSLVPETDTWSTRSAEPPIDPPKAAPPPPDIVDPYERPAAPQRPPEAANENWSSRPGRLWPFIVVATALTLAFGGGAGYYFAAKRWEGGAGAKIQTTPQGGAKLRFDYDLKTR